MKVVRKLSWRLTSMFRLRSRARVSKRPRSRSASGML